MLSSFAGLDMGPARRSITRQYEYTKRIAYAVVTLLWAARYHDEPTTFTSCTDSAVVYMLYIVN
jgi:hypothetical protein